MYLFFLSARHLINHNSCKKYPLSFHFLFNNLYTFFPVILSSLYAIYSFYHATKFWAKIVLAQHFSDFIFFQCIYNVNIIHYFVFPFSLSLPADPCVQYVMLAALYVPNFAAITEIKRRFIYGKY